MAIKFIKGWVPRSSHGMTQNTSHGSQGFAVIFVLTFIAVIIVIVGDVIYQTQIVAKHTMATQDQIEAQGTALTGMSVGKMLVKFHTIATSKDLAGIPISLPSALYASLNNISIGATSFIDDPTLTALLSPEILQTFKKIPGKFILNISSESCKFNLNLLQPGFSAYAETALLNLFSTSDAEALLQIYQVNANTLVSNLKEYIHKIKRPLLSVQELRLVDGFQYDDIYNIYAPYFTVWPSGAEDLTKPDSPPLNINCAPIELLASLFRPSQNAMINPIVWNNFAKIRDDGTKFKTYRDLSVWLDNNKTWYSSGNLKEIMPPLIGFQDSAYRIESRGIVNKTEQKLTIALRADKNGKLVIDYNQWSP